MRTANKALILLISTTITIVALFAAVCAGVSADSAHATDKVDYAYDVSKLIYRRGENAVALFYNGEVDTDVYFRVKVDDNDPFDVKGVNYFEYSGEIVKLWIVRDEDEVYNAYLSAQQTLSRNTYYDQLITLPYGQVMTYNGTCYKDDDVAFTSESIPCQAKDVGTYQATLNYETALTVPFFIVPAEVTVAMRPYSRRYGEKGEPTEVDVTGDVSEQDKADIADETFLIFDADNNSLPGAYPVEVIYNGFSTNYHVTTRDGEFVIHNGLLTGFTFEDADVLYDGEYHTLTVGYDASKWADVTITYDTSAVNEEGKYTYNATIKKTYYDDLVLTAVLTIRTSVLVGGDLDEFVSIGGDINGYDPTIRISLVSSRIADIGDKAASVLKSGVGYAEKILFTYDVKMTSNGAETYLSQSSYDVTIKLTDLTSMKDVRIVRYDGSGFKEIKYTYENGYIKFAANGLDGFVFIKKAPVESHSITNVIIAVGIGVAGLLLLAVLVAAFQRSGKARRRSRRRHSRWA